MPIYEYACKSCGQTFEMFLSSGDKPVRKCVHCKSTKITKLISNCSFQLKGSGWYVTDYGNKDKNTKGKSKKKDTDGGAPETSSKTDSKEPATSSDSKATATADTQAA